MTLLISLCSVSIKIHTAQPRLCSRGGGFQAMVTHIPRISYVLVFFKMELLFYVSMVRLALRQLPNIETKQHQHGFKLSLSTFPSLLIVRATKTSVCQSLPALLTPLFSSFVLTSCVVTSFMMSYIYISNLLVPHFI